MKKTLWILVLLNTCTMNAQNTVGLTTYGDNVSSAYVLFSPMQSTKTYLIDKCGEKVHEWVSSNYKPALRAGLLDDGSLLRTGQLDNPLFNEGGSGGVIEHFDWEGALIWSYKISDSLNCMHHDFVALPNGNILCIVWDRYSKQQAIDQGKNPAYDRTDLWSEKIVELKPIGTDSAVIVWEWKLWDHLVQSYDNTKPNYGTIADHPELVNLNYFPGAGNTSDWIHLNSIDYNPELDQILVSSHTLCELWIIDHSTTTAQAASHTGGQSGKGGDLLYRWGNPQAYNRGTPNDKVFYGQHHASWIPQGHPRAGEIMVFNNGLSRPGQYSSIDIIAPVWNGNAYNIPTGLSFDPQQLDWQYIAPTPSDFYSSNISGVYSCPNGSYLITSGAQGQFFEIDSLKQTQWSYTNPVTANGVLSQGSTPSGNPVFRSVPYAENDPAFIGRDLTPKGEIELNPTSPSLCEQAASIENPEQTEIWRIYPNPASTMVHIQDDQEEQRAEIRTLNGELVYEAEVKQLINTSGLPEGIYFLTLKNRTYKLMIVH